MTMNIYYDKDADLSLIPGKKVTIVFDVTVDTIVTADETISFKLPAELRQVMNE